MTDLPESNIKEISIRKDASEAAAEGLIRMAPSLARMRKALFDQYIAVGFTVDQALQLCAK